MARQAARAVTLRFSPFHCGLARTHEHASSGPRGTGGLGAGAWEPSPVCG